MADPSRLASHTTASVRQNDFVKSVFAKDLLEVLRARRQSFLVNQIGNRPLNIVDLEQATVGVDIRCVAESDCHV